MFLFEKQLTGFKKSSVLHEQNKEKIIVIQITDGGDLLPPPLEERLGMPMTMVNKKNIWKFWCIQTLLVKNNLAEDQLSF